MKKTPVFRKSDLALIAVLLLAALASLLLLRVPSGTGSFVEIYQDGTLYARYPLWIDRSVEIDAVNGHNTIEIKGGQVWVSDADCPGKDCMGMGKIRRAGQVILCAPHRLSVQITGGENAPDEVSY